MESPTTGVEINRMQDEILLDEAVRRINILIIEEISGLETEIINLTEQLSESDSLMIEVQRKSAKWSSQPSLRHRERRVIQNKRTH